VSWIRHCLIESHNFWLLSFNDTFQLPGIYSVWICLKVIQKIGGGKEIGCHILTSNSVASSGVRKMTENCQDTRCHGGAKVGIRNSCLWLLCVCVCVAQQLNSVLARLIVEVSRSYHNYARTHPVGLHCFVKRKVLSWQVKILFRMTIVNEVCFTGQVTSDKQLVNCNKVTSKFEPFDKCLCHKDIFLSQSLVIV